MAIGENNGREQDATGGLGSENRIGPWDEGLCAMPDETSKDESVAVEDAGEDQNFSVATLIWFIRAAAVCYLAILMYRLWSDDEIRLHTLHGMTRVLQAVARVVGMWALEFEQAYNDFVDTLH